MTPQDLTLLIGAIGAFFTVLGGGAKALLATRFLPRRFY